MKIDIITLFPGMFAGPFNDSIVKIAKEKKLVKIKIHNLRKWAKDKHKTVDDRPYGGGKGMVLMIAPIFEALKAIAPKAKAQKTKTILLTPQGKTFTQEKAKEFAKLDQLVLIAGHYEGFDERIRENIIDEEISIGDYVLTGGEIPAMTVIDAVVRLIPGVLDKEAKENESFSKKGLLDYPQYTRPSDYKGWEVPEVLLSGNHAEIEKWRKEKSVEKTKKSRPDLIKKTSR
jgi:tRNA (guanine37-N1)-methyltransferase